MISGTITAALLSLALAQTPPSTAASVPEPASAASRATAPDDPLALVRNLAQPPPTRTPFAEARFSQMLERPLRVSGELAWNGGTHLERNVTAPYQESTVIAGGDVAVTRAGRGTRNFSLERAPPLKALLQSMVAVLSGDPAQLDGLFDARVDGDAASWILTLTPKTEKLSRTLAHIRLDGGGHELRCIEISEPGGNVTIDLLGPLAAKMPTTPTRETLTALCRHAD
jgi:hypothetical protein